MRPHAAPRPSGSNGFAPDPHVDYSRVLTAAGGVLVYFKDFDSRLRHAVWALFAWLSSTGLEAWVLYYHSPAHRPAAFACFAAVGFLNVFIVAKPVQIYRSVEIRPDCMIVNGAEVFWLRLMEVGWPAFYPDEAGNQVLCGIYGTRLIQYLSIPRFDDLDRAPEVLAAHLQDAMNQLWGRPL